MIYLESASHDPYFNLALEQYAFDRLSQDQSYLIFWQNENSLIVGKHQNTMAEVNADYVEKHGIRVARRESGGGAVYHDLGNLNYTIITDAGDLERLDLHAFCMPLVNTLYQLGVEATISGRNDVTIHGKKCSGNSQYIKRHRVMHHGCILFDTDLSVASRALNVSVDKLESKGIKSVRSRMTNIKPYLKEEHTLEEFKNLFKINIVANEPIKPYELSKTDLEEIERLCQEKYCTWEWNYGASPQYHIQKARRIKGVGRIELAMEVDKGGVLTGFSCHGDYFGNGDSAEVAEHLVGCHLEHDALLDCLNGFPLEYYFTGLNQEDFINILLH